MSQAKQRWGWGCSREEYLKLRRMKPSPVPAFCRQRSNAKTRGISWELDLLAWWKIWQESGHWDKRGRGAGYMMCRIGDVGPYSPSNVFIASGRLNSSMTARKRSDWPMGVIRRAGSRGFAAHRSIRGKAVHLGTFATPELAHIAYLAAGENQ